MGEARGHEGGRLGLLRETTIRRNLGLLSEGTYYPHQHIIQR